MPSTELQGKTHHPWTRILGFSALAAAGPCLVFVGLVGMQIEGSVGRDSGGGWAVVSSGLVALAIASVGIIKVPAPRAAAFARGCLIAGLWVGSLVLIANFHA